MGIEPTWSAWKAEVLPLNYTRNALSFGALLPRPSPYKLVEGGGFEPPKAEPSDLQSDPFSHSGTPPRASCVLSSSDYTLSTARDRKSLDFRDVRGRS